MKLKMAYHSEQLFTLYTVVKTADRGSSRLIRIFDKSGVGVLVVIVTGITLFLLCLSFGFCLQLFLGRFRELSLLWLWSFLWFVKLLRVVPVSGLLM
jgi:hypothetical protein